ncbi:hypothetical protein L6452_25064 [Arctium lappa]|uniref:Uncharacterized protein n=1 Tax=Arctium lappa TaxID=4217 RepID=A0ACB9AAJ3_ARCLA|nr:hypothetical protein L6452_25064 [Arctium lappa]
MCTMADQISSTDSPEELPQEDVPQSMLRALVNQNQRLLEENHRLKARLNIYAEKMGRKKAKLENERNISRMRKADCEDLSRKLWEKTFAMDKLLGKVKDHKAR